MKLRLYLVLSTFTLLFLWGCEQEFDNTIESFSSDYQAVSVTPINQITYNQTDSLITITIKIDLPDQIKNVFCDVYASDNEKLNSSPIELFDNGQQSNGDTQARDDIFSNKFALSKYYPNGKYTIQYFVYDESNTNRLVAVGSFNYDNGQLNIAPVLSDDVIEPDTALVTSLTQILTSVKAFDANGQSDINKVYFIVYRPDGTTNGNQNIMYDDGNDLLHGDEVANDGIYSLVIQITSSNTKGTYRFEFEAIDRGGKTSNIINHNVLIQ